MRVIDLFFRWTDLGKEKLEWMVLSCVHTCVCVCGMSVFMHVREKACRQQLLHNTQRTWDTAIVEQRSLCKASSPLVGLSLICKPRDPNTLPWFVSVREMLPWITVNESWNLMSGRLPKPGVLPKAVVLSSILLSWHLSDHEEQIARREVLHTLVYNFEIQRQIIFSFSWKVDVMWEPQLTWLWEVLLSLSETTTQRRYLGFKRQGTCPWHSGRAGVSPGWGPVASWSGSSCAHGGNPLCEVVLL